MSHHCIKLYRSQITLILIRSLSSGFSITESTIWEKLHILMEQAPSHSPNNQNNQGNTVPTSTKQLSDSSPYNRSVRGGTEMVIVPTIFGERHNPDEHASVTNITSQNTTLSCVYASLCRGVIDNLHSMMSKEYLLAAGVTRIVGSGTTILKNAIIQRDIERCYKLPLMLYPGSSVDSALGAALIIHLYS